LEKDPSLRLGSKGGAKEVKNHAYFEDVNWKDVFHRKLNPPIPLLTEPP
jgi:hypothetical protein